jgi:electron transfer flavoprotein alpha subunit
MTMKILAFAEQREGKFKKSAFEVTQASSSIARQLGADHITIVIGGSAGTIAPELAPYGATRVIAAEDPRLSAYISTAYAKIVAETAKREGCTVLFFPASQTGKDLAARVAAKLQAGVASDCTGLHVSEGGDLIAERPVYAGKALIDVRVTSPVKIFTLRPNVFTAAPSPGAAVAVHKAEVALEDADFPAKVTGVTSSAGKVDVTEASIVVSGGRGMKGPEHFHLVEELAAALRGAVGASRAVVDAGWRPHDEQVGQTGKTVSPTLYIACGISGAIQHLAGMSSSKYIVAVNKDKDAPIFQITDYGIVGDVFEVLPALIREVKKVLGT